MKTKNKIKRNGESSAKILELLRAEIISGIIAPGKSLRQEELALRFSTSRMPVRECLKSLEREGLVEFIENRGAQVTHLDPDSFQEICEMRVVLESLALKHSIPELTNRQIEKAESIQDKAERSGEKNFGELNKLFHTTLIAPCGRQRLLAHIASLNDLSERYLRFAIVELDYAEHSHMEHRALLDACKARDTHNACKLVKKHISKAGEKLLAKLRGFS